MSPQVATASYQTGNGNLAAYNLAEWRSLRKGTGAECQPEYLGAKLAVLPSSAYSPLESALLASESDLASESVAPALSSFSSGLTDGWTLELWLKSPPPPIQAGDTAVVALVASDTRSSANTADLQTNWCGKGPPYGDQVSDRMRVCAVNINASHPSTRGLLPQALSHSTSWHAGVFHADDEEERPPRQVESLHWCPSPELGSGLLFACRLAHEMHSYSVRCTAIV